MLTILDNWKAGNSRSVVEPNGITLSEDGRVIYLEDSHLGIYKIDIKT